MIITKLSLPRRTFLRGVGAALGLPLLDAMVPALSAFADTKAVSAMGKATPVPSLELSIDLYFLGGQCENSYSCTYLNTLSWSGRTVPLPTENNPGIVFERLFGDGGAPQRRAEQARQNQSILD